MTSVMCLRKRRVFDLGVDDDGTDAIRLSGSTVGPRAVPLGEVGKAHIDQKTEAGRTTTLLCINLL